jgi:small-conductance mechanosensitive channel
MIRVNTLARFSLIAIVAFATYGSSRSAAAEAKANPGEDPRAKSESARATVASEIKGLRDSAEGPPSAKRLELLDRLHSVLTQHLAELQKAEDAGASKPDPAAEVEAEFAGAPPYSLAIYDEAVTRARRAASELAELDSAIESARVSARESREANQRAETSRRQAKDGAAPDLGLRELEARLTAAIVRLRDAELANLEVARLAQQRDAQRAEALQAQVSRQLEITPADLSQALGALDVEEAALRRRLERAELDVKESESRWKAAQTRLGSESVVTPEARDELALRRAQLSLRQKDLALATEQLERLHALRETARRRIVVLGEEPTERTTLVSWLEEARATATELARARRLDQAEITTLDRELQAITKRAAAPDATSFLREHERALQSRIALHRTNLEALGRAIASLEQLQSSLEQRAGVATLSDRIDSATERLQKLWNYELIASEDAPVTVGKIVTAILLIVFGLWIARALRRVLESRILPKFGLEEGASHAFGALAFYALLVIVVLLSLQTVSIPLTAFAVVGGALAIGVGFGSQNIVNNFISGVILLAERPIKVGDLVDVGGTYGNIERIGARSTRIRSGDNIHVIVPNSTFLESNVINWTHNDPRVRIRVNLGVVYGSPTRDVETLIRRALAEDPRIQQTPDPIILFDEFGDNSLNFSAHFWVRVRSMMDRLQIESAVRFRIDELFREADIIIAFPQRDVHLDTVQPLEIRLVDGAAAGAAGAL